MFESWKETTLSENERKIELNFFVDMIFYKNLLSVLLGSKTSISDLQEPSQSLLLIGSTLVCSTLYRLQISTQTVFYCRPQRAWRID